MAGLDTLNCGSSGGNTGTAACKFDLKKIQGMIIVPKGFIIPTAEVAKVEADVLTYLQNQTLETSKLDRFYPVQFVGVTDNSEDAVSVNKGYGLKIYVRPGKYNFMFETNEGMELNSNLRSFNNSQRDVYLITDDKKLIGTKSTTGLKALEVENLYTHEVKINDGANPALYRTEISLKDGTQMNENIKFYQFDDVDINADLNGLIDLFLSQVTAVGSATVKVKVSGRYGANIGEKYSAAGELAQTGAWTSSRTITAVSYDDATKSFILTVATTWAAADTISLASPTALAAENVVGYESNTLTLA